MSRSYLTTKSLKIPKMDLRSYLEKKGNKYKIDSQIVRTSVGSGLMRLSYITSNILTM